MGILKRQTGSAEALGIAGGSPAVKKQKRGQPTQPAATGLKEAIKTATEIKMRVNSASAIQATIDWNVKNDEAYAWANNPAQHKRFTTARTALDEIIDSDRFHRFFLSNSIELVKSSYGGDQGALLQRLERFAGQTLKTAIENLEREQDRFNSMHASNLEV